MTHSSHVGLADRRIGATPAVCLPAPDAVPARG